jgi:hypothetical protein
MNRTESRQITILIKISDLTLDVHPADAATDAFLSYRLFRQNIIEADASLNQNTLKICLPCYQTDPKKLVLGGPAEVP